MNYALGNHELYELNYDRLGQNQLWRIFTFLFANKSLFELAKNLAYILVLQLWVEQRIGSVLYLLDTLFKCVLVNTFSAFLYFVCLQLSLRLGSIFDAVVAFQSENSVRTFELLIVFFLVKYLADTNIATLSLPQSRSHLLLYAVFAAVFLYQNMYSLHLYSSVFLVALMKRRILNDTDELRDSRLVSRLNALLIGLAPVLYLKSDSIVLNTTASVEENKLNEQIDQRSGRKPEEKEQEEPGDCEVGNSKHEEVNIQQYLESAIPEKEIQPKDIDNFEI